MIPAEYTRKYAMLSGMISGGVDIRRRITGVKRMANTVRHSPAAIPKAMSVCTAFLILSRSFAPHALAITTPAPTARPLKNPTIMKIRFPDDETAASASRPRKLPTMSESAAL